MKYLSDYTQEKQTQLFKTTGAFFAFSMDQFNEQKVENTKYVDLGTGMVVPKENVDLLIKGLEKVQAEAMAADLLENTREGVIVRELSNHECFYTGELDYCISQLEEYGITEDEVMRAYFKERQIIADLEKGDSDGL